MNDEVFFIWLVSFALVGILGSVIADQLNKIKNILGRTNPPSKTGQEGR